MRFTLQPTFLKVLLLGCSLIIAGCGTAHKPVELGTSTQPFRPSPMAESVKPSNGSLAISMNVVSPIKAREVGDVLIVVLDENIRSNNSRNTNLNRNGSVDVGVPAISGLPFRSSLDDLALQANGSIDFSGQGGTNVSTRLQGQISVTVREKLQNGNLVIAGEKQIGNNIETEAIRITGTVDPRLIRNSRISSNEIADARLEYVGSGSSSNATSPGWFTELLLYFNPF